MADTLIIFIAGLGGVFLGMALLYISIRVTSLVTGGFEKKRKKND
jgi:Na+-transporting methylmalonyl-CoA/oxaloacetate decarboxylase gamma subunit